MVKSTLKDAQHHGDANQNHTEIPYHTHQDSYYQPKSSQAKPNQKITSVGKNVDKSGTLLNCCWEYKMVQLLWKTWWFSIKHGMVVPEKKTTDFTVWSSNSTSGFTAPQTESRVSKRLLHIHVHSSIIHNSQKVEANQMSTDGWVDTQKVVYTCNGILFSLRKEEKA